MKDIKNEKSKITVFDHITIKDKISNTIILNKRGVDIKQERKT